MMQKRITFGLIIGLAVLVAAAGARDDRPIIEKYQPGGTMTSNINRYNRTHRKGNIWLTITNWGFFGNDGDMEDPEFPGTQAPQCEYPGNSDTEYLFQGSIWVGALVQEGGFEFPRVSCGNEGWTGPSRGSYEFEPGEVGGEPLEEHGIRERSSIPNTYNRLGQFVYDSLAIGEQDFLGVYADTLTEQFWVGTDVVDGPHFPLGIRVAQSSYSWSYNYAQEFILIDYEFENIANNFLKNLYVALYIDADVGWRGEGQWHEDDICGFQQYYYYDRKLPDGTTVPDSAIINTAWIADNDGRPDGENSGNDFTCPAITGVRVVRAPNPRLRTAFNWWISNGNPDFDFGPAWQDDGSEGDWTQIYGTPNGDARKYFVMSNGEFDYDQIWVADQEYIEGHDQVFINPSTGEEERHRWRIESNLTNALDIANGYDTRYLLSWGPLGIFDHTDETGNDIYRLNPGEKFHMTIGYVAGANFHTPQNPQDDVSGNNTIDPTRFNFANLQYNAAWAARVFDNEMVDTNGDGWYGEDIGNDGLYAANIGDPVEYFGHYIGIYPGPDEDGSERNGKLDQDGEAQFIEGMTYWPEFVTDAATIAKFGELNIGFMKDNGILDPGDGVPDFKGPPPPPIPELSFETGDDYIELRWKDNAEDPSYFDPFSQVQDFEGYRIYVSNTGLEFDYELLAEFDQVNFAYYSISDSLATYPDLQTNLPADSVFTDGLTYYRKQVNANTGLEFIRESDSTYVYRINNAHPGFPRYYAVTSFDFGDPKSGTEPLETARNANAKYIAPSGVPTDKVTVVPNPYRAYENYTQQYVATSEESGLSWENQNDGTPQFFPQQDRRIEFMNLPRECLIRIYSVAGDLVAVIPHSSSTFNDLGDSNNNWVSEYSESWDLNSRNDQQVVSGLYIFSVEDLTPENKGNLEVGKFVIIR